jgi:hypothetical protein
VCKLHHFGKLFHYLNLSEHLDGAVFRLACILHVLDRHHISSGFALAFNNCAERPRPQLGSERIPFHDLIPVFAEFHSFPLVPLIRLFVLKNL